jgi:lipoprotein-anchoring transpeptidase ErfK/SrfK
MPTRRSRAAAGIAFGLVVVGAGASGSAAAPARSHAQPSVPRSSLVAYARSPVAVFSAPSAAVRPTRRLASRTDEGLVLSFLVRSRRPGWLRVYLPTRPNGSSGWIRRSQVRVYVDAYRVRVDLDAHTLTVWKNGRTIVRDRVGVGRAVSPTPAGTYYIVSRIRPIDPNTVYGSFAFGLSAHSNVYKRFGFGGDGRIGLHGTNDAAALGHEVSHGCIRTTNRTILRLSKMLPLGTPVEIVRRASPSRTHDRPH